MPGILKIEDLPDKPDEKRVVYEDGSVYEGHLVGEIIEGYGVMNYSSGARYEGMWLNGERHGRGVLRYDNGTIYEGSWEDGKRHGNGIYKVSYPRGGESVIEGRWEADCFLPEPYM